ncbi:LLM class flavin-dependent oxidoreductase [Rhodococcus sp. NPDC127530]|uniref:LLM class flavin-dependent oxidoreductase n=1 Tax=unclassified Rhodococcus (in: high G+C Gram-positive bacteria) TaxID=192944 RepID=UPI003633A2BE
MRTGLPLGPGSIGIGLNSSAGPAAEAIRRLRREAHVAADCGFDGLTLSEHHGGFPGYFPNPILLCGLILADMPHGWAAASPSILPLRNPYTVAEDLAWIDAAYPGRVAAGFVPGYQKRDFDALGAEFETRSARFWSHLNTLTGVLRPGDAPHPITDDAAIADARVRDLTVLVGVAGPLGARRAANADVGLLLMSLDSAAATASLIRQYEEAGGNRSCVLIRRVCIGDSATADRRHGLWLEASSGREKWLTASPNSVISGGPGAVAEALVEDLRTSGASALNIRVDADEADPSDVLRQIELIGAEVLPRVRSSMGWHAQGPSTALTRGVQS